MGQRVCCCRSGSTDALEMAQTPTTTDGPSEQTTRPAERTEPGSPEEKTDSEEAGRDRAAASAAHYFNSVCGKILAAGKAVPLVGEFCGLMLDAWQHIDDLKGTIDDAKDVIKWAEAQETFFRAILDTTRTDIEFEKALRSVAEDARDKMIELKDFARDIVPDGSSNESFLQRLLEMGRADLFKNEFRDAEEAAMKAMSKLTEALAAGTFFKLVKIEQQLGVVEQKVDEYGKGLHQKIDLLLRGQGRTR